MNPIVKRSGLLARAGMGLLALAGALVIGVIGFALAQQGPAVTSQNVSIPQVQSVNQTDCIWDALLGAPAPPWYCATPGMIGGVQNYSYSVPVTAFTLSPGNTTSFVLINPAGTLATGTLNLAANPSDGMNFCMESTQTQTALTVTANTGQTLSGTTVSALTAGTPVCWLFVRSTTTWYRTR